MKKLYSILLLTAFLVPHTSYSLNSRQIKALNEQLKADIAIAQAAKTRGGVVALKSFSDAKRDADTIIRELGDQYTSEMELAYIKAFSTPPAVVLPPAPTPPTPSPAGPRAVLPIIAQLNKDIKKNNDDILALFGPLGTKINLATQKNRWTDVVGFVKKSNDLADIARQKIALTPTQAKSIDPIIILTTTDPGTMTIADYGAAFILSENVATLGSLGTPTGNFYPTLYSSAIPFIAPTHSRTVPVAPAPLPATDKAAFIELINNHNILVDDLYKEIAGVVKGGSVTKDAVKAINAMAKALMTQAIAYGFDSSKVITLISTNNLNFAAIAAEDNVLNLIDAQIADTNAKLLTGAGYVYSTNHSLHKLTIPVKALPAGTPAPADNLTAVGAAQSAIVTDLFGAASATAIKTTQGSKIVVNAVNRMALDIMQLLEDRSLPGSVLIVSNSNTTMPAGTDPDAFIRDQMAATEKAFNNTWTGLLGHAVPNVYVVDVESTNYGAPALFP